MTDALQITNVGKRSKLLLAYELSGMFIIYGLIGLVVRHLYQRLPSSGNSLGEKPAPLGRSRMVVLKLVVLFSMDSFANGLVDYTLLALWLFQRFGLSLATVGKFFFSRIDL
jgi:hypothetical protein